MELGLCVVVILASFYVWKGFSKNCKKERQRKIMNSGNEAEATVLTIVSLPTEDQKEQFRIQIQVLPAKGRNFVAELDAQLTDHDLNSLKPGGKIIIKYLPNSSRDVVFVRVLHN